MYWKSVVNCDHQEILLGFRVFLFFRSTMWWWVLLPLVSGETTCPRKTWSSATRTRGLHDYYKHFDQLRRVHRQALYVGGGPSTQQLTEDASAWFENYFDVWTTTPQQVLTPRFVHADVYRGGPRSAGDLWRASRLDDNTTFIVDDDPTALRILNSHSNVFVYSKKMIHKAPCDDDDDSGAFAPVPCAPLSKVCASRGTVALQIIVLLGYDRILFIGVDVTANPVNNALLYQDASPLDVVNRRTLAGGLHSGAKNRTSALHHFFTSFLSYNNVTAGNLSPPMSGGILGVPYVSITDLLTCCKQQQQQQQQQERGDDSSTNSSPLVVASTTNPEEETSFYDVEWACRTFVSCDEEDDKAVASDDETLSQ